MLQRSKRLVGSALDMHVHLYMGYGVWRVFSPCSFGFYGQGTLHGLSSTVLVNAVVE